MVILHTQFYPTKKKKKRQIIFSLDEGMKE